MSAGKRAIRACFIGLAISIIGLAFGWLGNRGPPGAASTLATIGGILGYWQITALCAVVPSIGEFLATGMEHSWQRMAAQFGLIIAVPAFTWFTLIFALWSTLVGSAGAGASPNQPLQPKRPRLDVSYDP